MDLLFNIAMCTFAVLCAWIAWDDRIHTGFLGALSFGAAAVQSVRIMDDSVLRSVDGTQNAVLILVLSLMFAIVNVLYSMWKAGVFAKVTEEMPDEEGSGVQPALATSITPRRRRTDFGPLDDDYSDAEREKRQVA